MLVSQRASLPITHRSYLWPTDQASSKPAGTIVLFSRANWICDALGLFLQMAIVLTQLLRTSHKSLEATARDTIPMWDSRSNLEYNFHPLLGSLALHLSNSFLSKQVTLALGGEMK